MGVISRFKDIMEANINGILSKVESANADKLLEKYIQDAKENLGQIKAETAAVIAEEMAAARKLTENEQLATKYEGYATAAIKAGNDGDARKFLEYNVELATSKEDLIKNYENAKASSEKMRQMTRKLVGDIEEAQDKLNDLKMKLDVAKQQEKMNKMNEKLGSNPMGNFDNLFDAVQKRVDSAEATAQMNIQERQDTDSLKDLEDKYSLDQSDTKAATVEDMLAKLKQKVQ